MSFLCLDTVCPYSNVVESRRTVFKRYLGADMARICIDGFNLALPTGSGIATYARNLNAIIASLDHETQILFNAPRNLDRSNLLNQVNLFDQKLPAGWNGLLGQAWRVARLVRPRAREVVLTGDVIATDLAQRFPPAQRFWACRDIFHSANMAHSTFRRFTSLRLGKTVETDIMHWTAPMPLFEPRIANVYTLHDLIPLRLPFTTLDNKRAYYNLCRKIAKRADRVFTVSEHSRRDIIHLLGMTEDRVVNTYQAVDIPARFTKRPDEEIALELEGMFGLDLRGYFLYFGVMEPKKNLKRIVEAYLASGVQTPLVIVGRKWLDRKQKKQFRDEAYVIPKGLLSLSGRIKRYQYLPFASLVTLIQGAKAALFPSLYEGFGLPVLEAMQLGTPVLTSTAGSLPEVAGEAAVLVDPYDTDAIRDGIRALDADSGLRQDLTQKGRKQAALFSAERYRERLSAAYAPLL
jgi:glycosyltransferase involved in cell wall biosynthesis